VKRDFKKPRGTRFFFAPSAAKFWKHDISSASKRTFPGFFAFFLVAQPSPKRGVLVHKNSLASCQRCRHSVEPRALMCPLKHSDLIAWSLLSWHPTHKYLWGRLCFVKACCLLSTVTITPAETRIMSTEALLSKTVSVKIPRSAWAPGSRGTKQLETVATRVIAATESFYFAKSIGSQASVGAAVDEERWAGKTHLPARLVLAQSEQFEASKSVGCKWGISRAVYLIFCVILPGFVVSSCQGL